MGKESVAAGAAVRRSALALAILLVVAAPVAAQAPATPAARVVESCGVAQTYEAPPQRALPLDIGALEMLLALGLEDRIVGWYGDGDLLPENQAKVEAAGIERLGSSFPFPTFEAVLAENPDFVFAYGFNEETGFTPQALAGTGINFYSFPEACPGASALTVDFPALFGYLRDLGAIFAVEAEADAVIAERQAQLDAIAARIPTGAAPRRVMLMDFGEEAIFTAGRGALPTALIAAAGGDNVFGDVEGSIIGVWLNASFEEIAERDPEVLLVVDYGEPGSRIAFAQANPALSGTTAVRDGRFITVDYAAVVPEMQVFDAVELVAAGLWGTGGEATPPATPAA